MPPIVLPRNAQIWLPAYLASRWRAPRVAPTDVLFAIADHYEPNNGAVPVHVERERVARWVDELPRLAASSRDADGMPPRHTFFYAPDAYRPELLDALGGLCAPGLGEVEVHLHHDRDTSDQLRRQLSSYVARLADEHGLLSRTERGEVRYGFVHGNWALDNSEPDGRHCGVNDELTILRETGCYADFTMPAVPHAAQSRVVNAVYHAVDDPERPRSHDSGPLATVGVAPPADGLMMVQGPLRLSWRRRAKGVLPTIDVGAIDARNVPTLERFVRWVGAGVSVHGRPEWVFVKTHAHGAPEPNARVMLGTSMADFHRDVVAYCRRAGWRLHYVTAREMANIAWAAMDGRQGNAGDYRDYRLRWTGPSGARV